MKNFSRLVVFVALMLLALPVLAQDATEEAELTALVNIGSSDMLESFLVGPEGFTLYTFANDAPNTSNCVDQCAANWPPFTVESADALTAAEGIPGTLGSIERADGTLQVTYNGMPLYYWVNDAAPGDMTGDGVRGVWSIVEPAHLGLGMNADLGRYLVGPNGMTLYLFTNDEAGVSNCAGQCAENWPPFVVESLDDVVVSRDLAGEVSTVEREDGTLQVAYNGMPLYYFVNDQAVGDVTGQGAGDVWYIVNPETVAVGGNDELGSFVVGPRGYTLYIFTNDEAGVSNCVDQCAENWPPFTVLASDVLVAGAGIGGELGTIERADGSLQVTLDGMPLYYFVTDTAVGDATGEGAGDVWFVIPVEE